MQKHDTILMYGLVALGVLTSFLFISHGLNAYSSAGVQRWGQTFAVITLAYGMGNIAILSLAWTTRERWACVVHKLIALCYLGVFTMDSLREGLNSALQVIPLAVLGLILLANWLAVKKVVARD